MKILASETDVSEKVIRECRIPSVGLGTYRLRGKDCKKAVIDALEIGYRLIDTAQSYGNEEHIGNAILDSGIPREEIFIIDKVWFENLDPVDLRLSFQQSLNKLKSDYVDLLLIHWPSPENIPLRETLIAMHQLQQDGQVKCIGVSNFTPDLLEEALRLEDIVANEVEYHPFLNQERLLNLSYRHDLFLIAYSPLAQGEVVDSNLLRDIGRHHGKTPAQVVLRWLVQQQNVIAIPRSSSHQHRKSNFDIFDFELTVDEMVEIRSLANGRRMVDPEFAPDWAAR